MKLGQHASTNAWYDDPSSHPNISISVGPLPRTRSPAPPMLYDYYGFPPEAYAITYPAPGAPRDLVERVKGLLEEAGIPTKEDSKRGYGEGDSRSLHLRILICVRVCVCVCEDDVMVISTCLRTYHCICMSVFPNSILSGPRWIFQIAHMIEKVMDALSPQIMGLLCHWP